MPPPEPAPAPPPGVAAGPAGEAPAAGDLGEASPASGERSVVDELLELAAIDARVDELRLARTSLPARAELAAVEREAAELERRSRSLQAQRDERGEHEAALARSAGELGARIAHIEAQVRSGGVSFRDQEALSTELASLSRQRDALEDEELADLSALDDIEHESARLEADRPVLIERFRRATAAVQAGERAIDEQLAAELARRPRLLQAVGRPLGPDYEALREHLGGAVVARVTHGMCSGCRLALPATEADRLRHAGPDTTARCEQCGRILVP